MQGQSDDFRKVLRVFIASPGDLGEERRLFRGIVDEVNQSKANGMGTQLEPLGWEDTLPGFGRPQELINKDIKKCDLIIMLLWKRWGTPTGEYSSGFEEEYELAKRLREEEGKPEIMLYFHKIPDDMLADPGEQLRQVLKFKEEIESERKFLYKSYEDENQWEKIFREHLSKWLDGLQSESIEDQKQLKESEEEVRKGYVSTNEFSPRQGQSGYKYQVALSFAGEDRKFAKELAELLEGRGIIVFYDRYEQADLWGKDLYQHLQSVYKDKAQYCVVFLSQAYAQKLWTRHELESAQARAFREHKEYILPVKIDDTEIPGINETIGYIDLRSTSLEEIANMLVKKLSLQR